MANRGMNQDQQQVGRPNPLHTTPDDDEIEEGDVTQMEEAGNDLPRDGTRQAAAPGSDVEDEEAEGDEDEDVDADADIDEDESQDDEPIGNRV